MSFGVESKCFDSTVLRFKGSRVSAGVVLLALDEGMARGLLCCNKEKSIYTFTVAGHPAAFAVPLYIIYRNRSLQAARLHAQGAKKAR